MIHRCIEIQFVKLGYLFQTFTFENTFLKINSKTKFIEARTPLIIKWIV